MGILCGIMYFDKKTKRMFCPRFVMVSVLPDNFDTGLFQPGVKYHFTIIKKEHQLYMKVGLRHMWTRCSRYSEFRISVLQ